MARPQFQCHPGEETAGTQQLFSLAGKCTIKQLNIKARQGQARRGTGAWHRDQGRLCARAASLPVPTCPRPCVLRLCPGMGPAAYIPVTRRLVQGRSRTRALATRAEELPRAGRKPGAPRCSPCGSRPGGGMSQPRLLSLLLLLLCCQVRTGHPARWFSALQPACCLPPSRRRSTPARSSPLPRHAVQQPLPSPACPAIHMARHGMALHGMLACTSPWSTPSWGRCPARHGSPRGQGTGDAPRCPQGPSAQITDFLFESWKAYSEECHHNMSHLPAPTGESRCGVPAGRGPWREGPVWDLAPSSLSRWG